MSHCRAIAAGRRVQRALAVLALALTTGIAVAEAPPFDLPEPSQARLDPRLVSFPRLDDALDFPALSADNAEVALLYHPDVEGRSLAFDIVRVVDGKRQQHIVLLTQDEAARPASEVEENVGIRVEAANEYLSGAGFRVMQPLFWFDEADFDEDLLLEMHANDRRTTFDSRTGVLTIGDLVAAEGETWSHPLVPLRFASQTVYLQQRLPARVEHEGSGDSELARPCRSRPIPIRGWINSDWQQQANPQVVVLRIRHNVEPTCRVPDQWWVRPLSGTAVKQGRAGQKVDKE